MKLFSAFLRLIRLPNLVFIALTQGLFFFCVVNPIGPIQLYQPYFYLIVLASVLIAAAGYIINDYFDMHIDTVNKPSKVVVDKVVKRRWAIVWHLILSFAGVIISAWISWKTKNWIIVLGNTSCVLLLWTYSTTFKKRLLIGNVIIAALTAWVIVILYFYCSGGFTRVVAQSGYAADDLRRLYKFTVIYAGFAFIVSLIREVIKDLEDMEGDNRYHCKTMPIVWGVPAAKVFAAVWLVVCIGAMVIIQFYAWQIGSWLIVLYSIVFIIAPMLILLKKLYKAVSTADYHRLSTATKYIMLAGILSMVFLKFFR